MSMYENDVAKSSDTFVEVIEKRALLSPDRLVYRFLRDGEILGNIETCTYKQLRQRAAALAVELQSRNLSGRTLMIMHPPGLDYVITFFGCLFAGAIPVPVYPPESRLKRSLPRLLSILKNCDAAAILSSATLIQGLSRQLTDAKASDPVQWLATDDVDIERAGLWQRPAITRNSIAFLQYTSGSTGNPRGVKVTHGNLLANSDQIQKAFVHNQDSSIVSWLPPYHDMGLIGGLLQAPFIGSCSTLLSPDAFIRKPVRWIKAISHYRAVSSGGPNFAYELTARRTSEAQRESLDLSCWRNAFNGAEPINVHTMSRFVKVFAECGLRSSSIQPCYGLAENTLLASFGRSTKLPVILSVDAETLGKREVVTKPAGHALVACGKPTSDQVLRIVDPESTTILPENRVGEIWLSGPSVASGYWNDEAATKRDFAAHLSDDDKREYLRTGDLGFMHDGQLYVTGRLKDVIIIRGRNLWPQDIENTVAQSHPAIRSGAIAAFPMMLDDGSESLGVLTEVRKGNDKLVEIGKAVQSAIADAHGVIPYRIGLSRAGGVPRTSSGKIMRSASRACLLDEREALLYLATPDDQCSESTWSDDPTDSVAHAIENVPSIVDGQSSDMPDLSIFFFSSDADAGEGAYDLFLDSLAIADRSGFEAVWIPERHFHAFGGLFPNPAVLAAAAAARTKNLRIRSGSVVLPLHDPIRVAEEWAVVDQLSGGRVDMAFAVGWNPNDFVLAPDNYEQRATLTFEGIEKIRKLWGSGSCEAVNGLGESTHIKVYPQPLQHDIQLWLTCSGGEERFAEAGTKGLNVLTALLFQTPEELAARIASYRQAREAAGHDPDTGRVTLMLHAYTAATQRDVDSAVREPLLAYLASSVNLWRQGDASLESLRPEERAAVLDYALERYLKHSALIGTPAHCADMLARVKAAGVSEVACLLDFGVEKEAALASLEQLATLRSFKSQANSRSLVLSSLAKAQPSRHSQLQCIIRVELETVLKQACVEETTNIEFTALGLDSIGAVQLCERIESTTGLGVPASALFEYPTIEKLAGYLEQVESGKQVSFAAQADFRTDTNLLDDWLHHLPPDLQPPVSLDRILLTGATGFFGSFLLHQLLEQTQAQVECLIRASDQQSARERIYESLCRFGLWRDEFAARIHPIPGDLTRPNLGLTSQQFEALATRIDCIYHNGAVVNFAMNYGACRNANVGGTIAVLKLIALSGRAVPLCYVSTTAVFSHQFDGQAVKPDDLPDDASRLDMGYAQSKWVAESIVRKARDYGWPVTIYRPGLLTGTVSDGVSDEDNFIWNLIRVSVELGVFPDYDRELDMTPVDWAAAVLVKTSLSEHSVGGNFHLVNNSPISIRQLGRWFAQHGYTIEQATFERWQLRLFEHVTTNPSLSALLPILGLAAADFYDKRQVRFDHPDAAKPFETLGQPCPPVNDALLQTYLSAHVNREFLPPPGLAPLAHRKTLVVEQTLDADRIKDLVQQINAEPLPVNAFWWQPMQTLLEDMKTHAHFSDKGLRRASTRIVDCLSRHAKIESTWNRLPEIAQVPIERPLFIVSLPRTGTTLMHNLLALHPQNDTLKLWEMLAPVTPQGSGKQWEPQMKRIASEHLDEIYSLNPELLDIHPMAPEQPDECQWLMSASFTSPVFTLFSHAPGYAEWMLQADMTEAYRAYKRALQVLLWRQRKAADETGAHDTLSTRRLVLKCPGHLWHLQALRSMFPDACFLQMHRGMDEVLPSLASLSHALTSVEGTPADKSVTGNFMLDWLDHGVKRMNRFRQDSPEATFIDLPYQALLRDPVGAVEHVNEQLGWTNSDIHSMHIRRFMAGQKPRNQNPHRYTLQEFGLSPGMVSERFSLNEEHA